MELAFGYKNVPETAKAVLGVRAIYNGRSIDVVPDRCAWFGDKEELKARLTDEQWEYLQEQIKARKFGSVESSEVYSYENDGLNVIGSPQSSYGYLYLSFWI